MVFIVESKLLVDNTQACEDLIQFLSFLQPLPTTFVSTCINNDSNRQ